MSRTTDAERGARIAFDAAESRLHTLDLFADDAPHTELWTSIMESAEQQLLESEWARAATVNRDSCG